MRLLLVRHGETRWNRDRRVQGQSPEPLNDTGKRQAQEIAKALKGAPLAAIYASPLPRAMETAEAIAAHHPHLSVEVLEGLIEADVGELDGLTGAEMRERYPEFMRRWAEDPSQIKMPGGEALEEVQRRAWETLNGLVQLHPKELVVAVAHNFVIQCVLCRALELPLSHFRRLRSDLASFTGLELGGTTPVLMFLNDRCHLSGASDFWGTTAG